MKRSFYASLSATNRSELDKRLIDSCYSEYADIQAWLASEGCDVSEKTIGNHAEKLRSKLEALKLQNDYRRAYSDELADDIESNAINLIATAQRASQYLANALERRMKEYDEADEPIPPELLNAANTLSKTVSAIGTLNSSQVSQRKYHDEKVAKQQAKLDEMQAEGQTAGISIEWMNRIRTEVLGM